MTNMYNLFKKMIVGSALVGALMNPFAAKAQPYHQPTQQGCYQVTDSLDLPQCFMEDSPNGSLERIVISDQETEVISVEGFKKRILAPIKKSLGDYKVMHPSIFSTVMAPALSLADYLIEPKYPVIDSDLYRKSNVESAQSFLRSPQPVPTKDLAKKDVPQKKQEEKKPLIKVEYKPKIDKPHVMKIKEEIPSIEKEFTFEYPSDRLKQSETLSILNQSSGDVDRLLSWANGIKQELRLRRVQELHSALLEGRDTIEGNFEMVYDEEEKPSRSFDEEEVTVTPYSTERCIQFLKKAPLDITPQMAFDGRCLEPNERNLAAVYHDESNVVVYNKYTAPKGKVKILLPDENKIRREKLEHKKRMESVRDVRKTLDGVLSSMGLQRKASRMSGL